MTRPLVFLKSKHNRYSAAAVLEAALSSPSAGAFAPAALSPAELAANPPAPGARPVFLLSYMTPHRRGAADLMNALRARHPDATLVAGGPHPTGDPDDALASGADHAVAGCAFTALPGLLDALAGGGPPPPPRLAGPLTAESFRRYSGHAPSLNLFAPVEISRGCPNRCRYCMVPAQRGGTMIHRDLDQIARIARTAASHGRTRTWLVSSDALAYGMPEGRGSDPAALEELLVTLESSGIREIFFGSFPSEVNPDQITDETLAVLARHVANRMLTIGGQSGADSVLGRMHRPHDAARIRHAARTARRHGFTPHIDILLGTPGETGDEREATFRMVDGFLREGPGRIHFHYFMPLPATPWSGLPPEPLDERALSFVGGILKSGRGDGYFEQQLGFLARTGT